MSTSEWITDRLPTEEDGRMVYNSHGQIIHRHFIKALEAWKHIPKCGPYVKPKRYMAERAEDIAPGRHISGYVVYSSISGVHADRIPTREAAERIAAIYEEVMP